MPEQNDILNLIKLAKQGDTYAFGELIQGHERFVYNIVYRMLPNQEDVKDISQEVFLKVYKYLNRFDGKASFSTWLYRIAVNTCIDELRKRKGKETISLDVESETEEGTLKNQFPDNSESVEDQVMAKESMKTIKQAMNKLSDEHRTIITLRDIEGLSYTEISEITETSLGTVKSRLARARKTLKDLLVSQEEQKSGIYVK